MRLFRLPRRVGVPAALLAGLLAVAPTGVVGQPPKAGKGAGKGADKEYVGKGEVRLGGHRVKLEAGKLYRVRVETDGFTPAVTVRPGFFIYTGDSKDGVFQGYVLPQETREYRFVVSQDINDEDAGGEPGGYTVTVTPMPMAPAPLLEEKSRLALTDPPYNNPGAGGNRGPHKAFTVNFKAGQVYVVTVDAADKGGIDPYLYVETKDGKIMAQDDDGGGYPNCRLFFKPRRGGEHRLVVTALNQVPGAFTLRVLTTADGAKAAEADGESK